jgi:MFS-type transporter involved in bile tolerance (Atg22 family)
MFRMLPTMGLGRRLTVWWSCLWRQLLFTLLATMVAHTAPAQLRGTAFGFFNLLSGVVMLASSVIAGVSWDRLGAAATFYVGVVFCVLTIALLLFGRTPDAAVAH